MFIWDCVWELSNQFLVFSKCENRSGKRLLQAASGIDGDFIVINTVTEIITPVMSAVSMGDRGVSVIEVFLLRIPELSCLVLLLATIFLLF